MCTISNNAIALCLYKMPIVYITQYDYTYNCKAKAIKKQNKTKGRKTQKTRKEKEHEKNNSKRNNL